MSRKNDLIDELCGINAVLKGSSEFMENIDIGTRFCIAYERQGFPTGSVQNAQASFVSALMGTHGPPKTLCHKIEFSKNEFKEIACILITKLQIRVMEIEQELKEILADD